MTQTYNTINEAFANGTGDVFFTKNGKYIAVSRHSENFDTIINEGFNYLPYDEVLTIGRSELPKQKSQNIENNISISAKVVIQSPSYSDRFYEDYPDAYNQSL